MNCEKKTDKNNLAMVQVINFLIKQATNPSVGLPEDIFLFISRMTPMVNVDLLIKDENERTLLSWRNDQYAGVGWHIPGGIIRFKESFEERIAKVAETEIGIMVEYNPAPIAINQIIYSSEERGHFISLLYKCFLSNKYVIRNKGLKSTDKGYLQWHNSCPNNLISSHDIYRKYL